MRAVLLILAFVFILLSLSNLRGVQGEEQNEPAPHDPLEQQGEGEEGEGEWQGEEGDHEEGEWQGEWQGEGDHEGWEDGHYHDEIDPAKEHMYYYLDDNVTHYELLVFLFTHHPENWGDDLDFEDAMQKLRDNRYRNWREFEVRRNEYKEFLVAKQGYQQRHEERRKKMQAIHDEL